MREVSIIGIGQTDVGEHWERSLRDLAVDAMIGAIKDSHAERVDALYVGNMLSGELTAQQHLGALLADWGGLGAAAPTGRRPSTTRPSAFAALGSSSTSRSRTLRRPARSTRWPHPKR